MNFWKKVDEMGCCCEKKNGYVVQKCGYHYDKRKTIFQLYKEKRKELEAVKGENESLMHLLKEERKDRVNLERKNIDYKGVMCSKCGHLNEVNS